MSKIKGIKYVGPIFDNCYDSETEVLTGEGWKYFKDVTLDDKMCTLNSTQTIEYHKPTSLINKYYKGNMYHFTSPHSKIDLLVTPNHNMYTQSDKRRTQDKIHEQYVQEYGVAKLSESTWGFETAESIVGKHRYFKKDANYKMDDLVKLDLGFREVVVEDWLEFLGYYLSEGSATITKDNHYVVQIRQFGFSLHKMAKALAKISIGKINIIEADGRVIVNDKALCCYLNETFGKVYDKYIPRDILNNCSKKQLSILFESLMLGDGHDLRSNYIEGRISGGSSYHTASFKLKDCFMELLLKIGYSGAAKVVVAKGQQAKFYDRIVTARADNWSINIKFSNNVCAMSKGTNFGVMQEDYKGTIHCVTVKNHTLYVRRNGCSVWSGNSGYAKACRGNIFALLSQGIDVTLLPTSFEKSLPELGTDGVILKSLVNKSVDYNVVITHTTPEFWSKYVEPDKINIGYTIWETTKLHPDWVPYINDNAAKVLVGCDWNISVFKDSGVIIPIGCVPHSVDLEDNKNIKPYSITGVPDDTYVFYSIFQWTERKAPLSLIKAYWYAFQNNENVALVLKAYRSDYSDAEKTAIRTTIKRLKYVTKFDIYPKIYFISDMLTEDEIRGLHMRGDCYVTSDRGEGFGLSPFTAGAYGKPVIATGFGGSLEYLNDDNSFLVPYTLTPVMGMPWSPWYKADQLWAEVDTLNLANNMYQVYANQEDASDKGTKLQKHIRNNFSHEAIGKRMVKEIEDIV